MDTSIPAQNRRSRRSNVLLTATIQVRGTAIPVKLRNLSSEGALVESEDLPMEGMDVLFERNELCEPARVVWVSGKHAGIAFKDKLKPEQVMQHVPVPRPRILPEFRRPGLACRALTPEEQHLVQSWVWAPARGRHGE